jgi:hypothetical protein
MILISHRGNIEGKKEQFENEPNYILLACKAGYNCEIDVRYENEKWFLGHDKPEYEIPFKFLLTGNFWIHAKTIITLHELMKYDFNCFYHENDPCVLTSKGYIWTYPGFSLGPTGKYNKSICVLPELNNITEFNCVGICSDNIKKYKL